MSTPRTITTICAPLADGGPLADRVDAGEQVMVLSASLEHPLFEPQAVTLATLDGYSITLHRFFDGERAEVFELSGIEVERLMSAYRLHLRRLRRQCKRDTL